MQWQRTETPVSLHAHAVPQPYPGEIVDVSVRHFKKCIDSPSEGVDLLVRVPHEDDSAGLGQHHVHDG